MRLRKSALVIIVVIMVAATGFLSSQMLSYASNFKIGYIHVVADKAVFAEGEDVTFELRSLTPDVAFTVTGNTGSSGVYIYHIPSGLTPEQYLHKFVTSTWLESPSAWGRVAFGNFNESDSPLRLTWNGTYEVSSSMSSSMYGMPPGYYQATSGYYLLFPRSNMYEMGMSSGPKPMIDSSSIFYYDALIAESNVTSDPMGSSLSTSISIRLADGSAPLSSCPLVCRQQVWGINLLQEYHNYTVDLGADHWTSETFLTSASSVYYGGMQMWAILTTPSGDYLFGFDADWYGGELTVRQF